MTVYLRTSAALQDTRKQLILVNNRAHRSISLPHESDIETLSQDPVDIVGTHDVAHSDDQIVNKRAKQRNSIGKRYKNILNPGDRRRGKPTGVQFDRLSDSDSG
eukprot:gene6890-7585_t